MSVSLLTQADAKNGDDILIFRTYLSLVDICALVLLRNLDSSFLFGRVQLNLFLCCPFGDYELELVVESFSDEGSELQQRTSWEIENGPDEVYIYSSAYLPAKTNCCVNPATPAARLEKPFYAQHLII